VKRHLIAALVVVAALIAGALGLFGRHIGSAAIAVDNWLREALYKLQRTAVTQVADTAVPIAAFVAGGLLILLIVLVLRGLRKVREKHFPGARRKRRRQKVARGADVKVPQGR
jgi:hypothetical protein